MPARQESCCFTGHRPAKLPWGYNERDPRCVRLKERIADAVLLAYQEGYRHFLCGMAQGCDLYFCEAVLALRDGGMKLKEAVRRVADDTGLPRNALYDAALKA